ncbi:MAG: hypothetical protein KatS3mg087_0341 [Patescibacteria group bacterium]|nr:MAG: hypothetical protein KatS3mg087_0341 [Patescibacteria group bacterium]
MQNFFEYVVIGAGSGGLTVAVGMQKLGKNVAIISKNIGGECTFTGCVPSKTILHLTKQRRLSQNDPDWQERTTSVFEKVRKKIADIAKEDAEIVKNIPTILGDAKFLGRNALLVNNQKIEFKKCIIATGSNPLAVNIPGLEKQKTLTNENIFDLNEAPKSLMIIGGGPIGCEMATAFCALGTEVQIISRGRILPKDPETVVELARNELLKNGVRIFENSEIKEITGQEVVLANSQKLEAAEYYLLALGRTPNLKLDLEKAGVKYVREGIVVDKNLRTSQRHIFAIGDCTTSPKFTHLAYHQATKVITQQISSLIPLGVAVLPWVTFTDPPIASVGVLNEDERINKFVIPFRESDRAKIEENKLLYGEIYVDSWTAKIVGASLVGEHAEHLINLFTLAIQRKTHIWHLMNFITPYPTYANALDRTLPVILQWWVKRLPKTLKNVLSDNVVRITAAVFWITVAYLLFNFLKIYNFDVKILADELFRVMISEWGVLVLIVLYCLRPFISFSATVLSAVAGAVYGFVGGLLLTIIASNLSTLVAYYLGRTVFAARATESEKGWNNDLRLKTFQTTLTARLIYLPYDLVSYVAGGVRAPVLPFLAGTALGSLPGSIAIVSFGASLENFGQIDQFSIQPIYIIVGISMILLSLLLGKILK